jgi:transposase, IS30 family
LALERSASSVCEEIKRNSVNGKYTAKKAEAKYLLSRSNSKYQMMSLVGNVNLKKRVEALLLDDISPSNVAGRIRKESKGKISTSKTTIYRYIKSIYGRKIEYHRKSIKYKNRSKVKTIKLKDRVNISKRPKVADNRSRYGHAEGDFIVSGKAGTGILLVVVDRKVRKTWIRKIVNVSINKVHEAFLDIQKSYLGLKTLTLDNDILFRKHLELELLLKAKIYFCNPYHSWEKGTVENTNKYIRRYIKKSSDISLYSDEYIQEIEDKLNRRPMECLDHSTPDEIHNKYLKRINKARKN